MPATKKNVINKAPSSSKEKTVITKRCRFQSLNSVAEPVPVGWKAVNRKFTNRPKRCCLSSMGFFQFLPIEIKFKILKYFTADSMATFACASKSSNQLVLQFLKEQRYLVFVTKNCFKHNGVSVKKCREFGTVLRVITSPYPFAESTKIITEYCHALRDEMNVIAKSLKDFDGSKRLRAMGLVLKSILKPRLHSRDLLMKVVQAVQTQATMEGYDLSVAAILQATPFEKIHIRNFYHKLFLECHECWCDRIFMLTAILDTFPTMKEKAAMLVFLYGPLNNHVPVWHLLPQISLMTNDLLKSMLFDLAECLMNIQRYGDFNVEEFMELLHEICQYPNPWRQENKILLIMLSGYGVTVMYMHQSTWAVLRYPGIQQIKNNDSMVFKLCMSEVVLDELAKTTLLFLCHQNRFPQMINESSLKHILHMMLKVLAEKKLHVIFLDRLWNKVINNSRTAFIQNFHANRDRIFVLYHVMHVLRQLQTLVLNDT